MAGVDKLVQIGMVAVVATVATAVRREVWGDVETLCVPVTRVGVIAEVPEVSG
jgi:hypothetical protein